MKFNMLSTKILVQSYTWTHFLFTFLLNLMFTMLSTQISYKSIFMHNVVLWDTYKSYINIRNTMLSSSILHRYIFLLVMLRTILYLDNVFRDTYSVYYMWNYHVKYTDFSSILLLGYIFSYFCEISCYHVKYTDFI